MHNFFLTICIQYKIALDYYGMFFFYKYHNIQWFIIINKFFCIILHNFKYMCFFFRNACYLCCIRQSVLSALDVLDTVVCYAIFPQETLRYFICTLCRTVNDEAYCSTSWKVLNINHFHI